MLKKAKKIIALSLSLFMLIPLIASCGILGAENGSVIVSSSNQFNGIFNPVLYHTAYDGYVCDLVFTGIYGYDRNANLVDASCIYQKPEQYTGDDGEIYVKYTYKIRDGLKFSDGKPVTADDIIFTFKLYLDPTYDGLASLWTVGILGVNEYRFDDPSGDDSAIKAAEEDAAEKAEKNLTEQDKVQFVYDDEGMSGVDVTKENVIKYLMENYKSYFPAEEDAADYIDSVAEDAAAVLAAKYMQEYWENKMAEGEKVPEVEGIKKIDDSTVEVTVKGIQATDELDLGLNPIIPKHYYGKNYKKGDLTEIKKLNGNPVGAGPFKFKSYADNVVTLTSNKDYYEGAPKLNSLKFQVIDSGSEYTAIQADTVDISDPSASVDQVDEVEKDGYHYNLIDNSGYGYIGINAERVPDKNVRKALMHLMNRGPAVEAYYGNLATVIERPMSKVCWAYPESASEYYGYSTDKALQCFNKAGYVQEDGKLMKDGKQFSIDLWISSPNHPVVPLFTQMKIDLEKLGAVCNFHDTDWSVYNEKYQQGLVDVWAAAWGGGSGDPDSYQMRHSSQIANGNNPYRINNAELDALLMEGKATLDKEKRKDIYAKVLDIVMDEAVEMPFYQRMNMYVMNQNRVDVNTLPKDMTPFYGWYAEVQNLQAVEQAQ